MKRRSPLQVLWKSIECISLADGQILVTPVWRADICDDGIPGVITRMYAARQLEKLIRRELKR